MTAPLVQELVAGPLDIVGDVHGEIDALRSLMSGLGYAADGKHREGRQLVFVGDLTDRGPDSPAVVDLVSSLVDAGRGQCVLGNHDLNILLGHSKLENKWFFGEEFLAADGRPVPQRLADDDIRFRVLQFFTTLPLALARDDVRVVHACWNDEMIERARQANNTTDFFARCEEQVESERGYAELDPVDQGLRQQNHSPVKLLTSGPEQRTQSPVDSGGKIRNEKRVVWWPEYSDAAFCVFGHYSIPEDQQRGSATAFCVDFGVGKRWTERLAGKAVGFAYRLAALRHPEMQIAFDDGAVCQASDFKTF
jgi:hypothetical protein